MRPETDWTVFAAAGLMLLLPLPLLFGRSVAYRELNREWEGLLRGVVALPWHWIDLFRAGAGTWLLAGAIELGRTITVTPGPDKFALLWMAAVLWTGVVVQTVGCKHPDSFHAPLAFVTGVVLALLPPIPAGLSLVCGITLALAFRTATAFFGGMAVAVVVFGVMFYPKILVLAIGAVTAGLPLLLPVLFSREMVLAHRR